MFHAKNIFLMLGGLFVSSLFIAPDANATKRINGGATSCASVQNTIIQNGAAIVRYPSKRKPGMTLYDRYVASSDICQRGEVAEWSTIRVKGGNRCRLLTCERFDRSDYPFGKPYRKLRVR